jgi:hypothetical protein
MKSFKIILPLLAVVLAMTACSGLKKSPPKAVVKPGLFSTNASDVAVTMSVMQMKAMRFADEYAITVAQAAEDFSNRVGTPEARLAALKWKLSQATAAYIDASGVNPVVNALDLLTLVTVSRMVIEDYAMEKFGTNALPVLETQKMLEAKAWELANGALKPAQKLELENLILEWRRNNPHQRYVGAIRFVEFAAAAGQRPTAAGTSSGSIFSLLFLDPFAGLDPTTAAIEEAQQFGERLMYYAQRMPQLLSWQAEVAALELASQPESRQILTNAQQLACAADSFAKTAAQFPQVINDQREAAINQVFDRLTAEGTNARAMLVEARDTLTAGSDTAKSINAAIKSLDDFVRYCGAPSGGATTTTKSTNNHPFNVLDYGAAASQIGAAAKELNAAIVSLNQTTPQLSKLSNEAAASANQVVTRAFWLGLVLILVLVIGLLIVAKVRANPSERVKKNRDSGESST